MLNGRKPQLRSVLPRPLPARHPHLDPVVPAAVLLVTTTLVPATTTLKPMAMLVPATVMVMTRMRR